MAPDLVCRWFAGAVQASAECCRRQPHREQPHGQGTVSQHAHSLSMAALCQGSVKGPAQQAARAERTVGPDTGRPAQSMPGSGRLHSIW